VADQRFFRTLLLGGATLVRAGALDLICGCGVDPDPPPPTCYPSSGFSSYCEVLSVTTTCGVPVSCVDAGTNSFGNVTGCTIDSRQLTSDCTFTVTLADGTVRTILLSVFPSGIPGCSNAGVYGIALPLECQAQDGGSDATADASDASDASASEDSGDAAQDASDAGAD